MNADNAGIAWVAIVLQSAAVYATQIQAQYDRVAGNLPSGGTATYDPNNPNVQGAHANFQYTCDTPDWSGCGPNRYDNGVHVECASGGYNCPVGSSLVVHDDTVSPWVGHFSFSDVFTANFWEHGFVDLFYGQLCSCVFSH